MAILEWFIFDKSTLLGFHVCMISFWFKIKPLTHPSHPELLLIKSGLVLGLPDFRV